MKNVGDQRKRKKPKPVKPINRGPLLVFFTRAPNGVKEPVLKKPASKKYLETNKTQSSALPEMSPLVNGVVAIQKSSALESPGESPVDSNPKPGDAEAKSSVSFNSIDTIKATNEEESAELPREKVDTPIRQLSPSLEDAIGILREVIFSGEGDTGQLNFIPDSPQSKPDNGRVTIRHLPSSESPIEDESPEPMSLEEIPSVVPNSKPSENEASGSGILHSATSRYPGRNSKAKASASAQLLGSEVENPVREPSPPLEEKFEIRWEAVFRGDEEKTQNPEERIKKLRKGDEAMRGEETVASIPDKPPIISQSPVPIRRSTRIRKRKDDLNWNIAGNNCGLKKRLERAWKREPPKIPGALGTFRTVGLPKIAIFPDVSLKVEKVEPVGEGNEEIASS